MIRFFLGTGRSALGALLLGFTQLAAAQLLEFSDAEKRAILRHGPWPAPWSPDPSNRVSGKPEAIELGERLFFEPRISPSGKVLCATCHAPFRAWQDARARAFGHADTDRNTQTLFDVRYNRWFGWDGAGDSLWAQSIRPMLDAREMGGSQAHAAALVRGDAEPPAFTRSSAPPTATRQCSRESARRSRVPEGDRQRPFASTTFARRKGRAARRGALQGAARAGCAFSSAGNCSACHFGPTLSNGEFHDTGVPFFIKGGVDPGRHGGIQKLAMNALNLLGAHNDDRSGASAIKTRQVAPEHRNFGEFKVPSLRNVAQTAPYMHTAARDARRRVATIPTVNPIGCMRTGEPAQPLRLPRASRRPGRVPRIADERATRGSRGADRAVRRCRPPSSCAPFPLMPPSQVLDLQILLDAYWNLTAMPLLTPPNGATSVDRRPLLTHTIPVSIASATRQIRPRSRA